MSEDAEKLSDRVATTYPTFICGSFGCDITYRQKVLPERDLANNLLEDIGDWHRATRDAGVTVPRTVAFALAALHDAVCNWVEHA